jgi:Protein of Unknown function (DUF2784)
LIDRLLADLVVGVHFFFVLFVLLGGLLVLRWPRLAFIHLPAAAWGVLIELTGWICPLTPLENTLRTAAGGVAYQGDFVAHYILPVLYPSALTRNIQLLLGCLVLGLNLGIYGYLLYRRAENSTSVTRPRGGDSRR